MVVASASRSTAGGEAPPPARHDFARHERPPAGPTRLAPAEPCRAGASRTRPESGPTHSGAAGGPGASGGRRRRDRRPASTNGTGPGAAQGQNTAPSGRGEWTTPKRASIPAPASAAAPSASRRSTIEATAEAQSSAGDDEAIAEHEEWLEPAAALPHEIRTPEAKGAEQGADLDQHQGRHGREEGDGHRRGVPGRRGQKRLGRDLEPDEDQDGRHRGLGQQLHQERHHPDRGARRRSPAPSAACSRRGLPWPCRRGVRYTACSG